MSSEFELPPAVPSTTPLQDAVDHLGASGEGLDVTAIAGENQAPTISAGGWLDFGKRDQFGAGAAVQWAKGTWATIAKLTWRPGARK